MLEAGTTQHDRAKAIAKSVSHVKLMRLVYA